MPKNDIGGFFVSLGLAIDKPSFETGNKLIDGVTTGLNKLIGTARNAAVVLTGTAVATGVIESAAYKTATAIGISTETLDLWKASAKIAGVDANGLVNAMARMSEVMQGMTIDGRGLEAFTKQLGELGLITDEVDIEKLLKMSPDELMKEILIKAQGAVDAGQDRTKVSLIVKDILGEAGQQFFIELERQGKTIDEFLSGAQKTIYTDSGTNAKAADFAVEINTLKTTSENLTKLLGSEVGGELTKYVKGINGWIEDNGTDIKTAIQNIAKLTGIIASKVAPYAKDVVTALVGAAAGDKGKVVEATDDLGFQLASDFTGLSKDDLKDKNKVAQEIAKYKTQMGYKVTDWIPYSELTPTLQEGFDQHATKSKGRYRLGGAIKDGIVRPDGTITQVASDDWVLAARSLGDLARAFTPQNYTAAGTNEYVINQTFNINGGTDMPQVLRQQAYQGTQEGLLQLMTESSRRLQLMSGTR